MENLTYYLDPDHSTLIENPKYQALIDDLIRNHSQIRGDFNVDDSDFDDNAIKNKVINKIRKCIVENINVETCLKSLFTKETPKDNFDYETMTTYLFHVVLLTLVGVFGCVGNASIVIMFARIQKQLTFHRLMIMLSVCDTFLIILSFLVFSLPFLDQHYYEAVLGHIAPVIFPLAKVSLTASIYSTLAIAFERYLIICHPFYVINHRMPAKRYIIFILIFSVLYNLPRFFSFTTFSCSDDFFAESDEPSSDEFFTRSEAPVNAAINSSKTIQTEINCTAGTTEVRPTALRLNYYYYSVYLFWMDLCVMEFLPIVVLIVLNMLVLKSFRKKLKKRLRSHSISIGPSLLVNRRISSPRPQRKNTLTIEHIELGLAKLSLVIVFIFILCHSFKLIPNIYELFFGLSQEGELQASWIRSIIHFSNFLIVLCCSSNFYVYCYTHLNVGRRIQRWSKNIHECLFSKQRQRHLETETIASV